MSKILLVRHGATDWNVARRAQGQADIPLNHVGRAQAQRVARELAGYPVDAVYSSDLQRAVDTARAIAAVHSLEVVADSGFREIDQGDWEGLTTAEIQRRWPGLWGPARHVERRPAGESPDEVVRRALAALTAVVEAVPGGIAVVVSHGGTIRWLVAHAKGYGVEGSARLRGLANGGVISLDAALEDGRLTMGGVERLDGASPDRDDPNQ